MIYIGIKWSDLIIFLALRGPELGQDTSLLWDLVMSVKQDISGIQF